MPNSVLRIRYGLALGRENNFYTGVAGQKGYLAGTDGLLAQGNTSPDVTLGTLFYTNNSAATVINSFQLYHPTVGQLTTAGSGVNFAPLFEGKVIKIVFLDSNTTIAGNSIYLSGTDNAFNARGYLDLMYHASAWYEIARVNPYANLTAAAATVVRTGTGISINANWVNSILLTLNSAGTVINSVSGGMIGQRLLIINNNSSGTFTVATGGNIVYSMSNAGVMTIAASGGTLEIVKVDGTRWGTVNR